MEGDMEDYWNECRLLPSLPPDEETGFKSCEEGEAEAEWLVDVGLSQLTAAYHQGQEVVAADLDKVVEHFSPGQAEAVRRRVRTLNNTIRQRKSRHRARKADVRDVFRDSAVPKADRPSQSSTDSTESGQFTTTVHLGDESLHHRRRNLARYPSVPLSSSHPFRNYNPDVAGSDGLRLISFQYLGTLPRHRSGSDPLILDDTDDNSGHSSLSLISSTRLSRSHGSLLELTPPYRSRSSSGTDRTWIDSLDPSDVEQLRPLLVAEATTIMDDYCTQAYKRKPIRVSKKPEGNVFGAPLSVLLEKDARLLKDKQESQSHVPSIMQMLVYHLERNNLKEEGLLRVAGLKTRIDSLISTIETSFYTDRQAVEKLLFSVSPHDITAVLKKLLRELPEPLLTYKLIWKFYATHAVLNREIQKYVMNLLVLQLPREHQAVLRFIFQFVGKMLEAEEFNKMGVHSIATILAPSIFPPRCITNSKENMKSQVELAERCIKLTEMLLSSGESLWVVPRKLIDQLRSRNHKENGRQSTLWHSKRKSTADEPLVSTMLVEAPQFHLPPFEIPVSDSLTARDVVLQVIKEGMNKCEENLNEPLKIMPRGRLKPLAELTHGMALSCLLSGAGPETALQTHFLFEHGGNIVQRELEHSALIADVLKDNPAAHWKLECRHRNCPKR